MVASPVEQAVCRWHLPPCEQQSMQLWPLVSSLVQYGLCFLTSEYLPGGAYHPGVSPTLAGINQQSTEITEEVHTPTIPL